MVRILNGSFHQGQIMSPSAGYQCTAIALYALLLLACRQVPNPGDWCTNHVDLVVSNGHHMYEQIISSSQNNIPRYLGHWELPAATLLNNGQIVYLTYHTDNFYGVISTDTNFEIQNVMSMADDRRISFSEALARGSGVSNYLLLTIGSSTISLARTDSQWHIFDSHGRDSAGMLSSNGYASLLTFSNTAELINFICINFHNLSFDLTPVIFEYNPERQAIFTEISPLNIDSTPMENGGGSKTKHATMENETLKQEVCVSESHDNILFNHDTDTYLNTYFESNNIQKKRRKCDESCSKMTKNSNKKSLSRGEVRYEENIRSVIRDYCVCCEKMLFSEQVRIGNIQKLDSPFQAGSNIKFKDNSCFCSLCLSSLSRNCLPPTCKFNNLFSGDVPDCLKNLNTAEKRMIAQIQSFMTILILPGGQYAEKGLAIHFPLDLDTYYDQLLNCKNEQFLVIRNSNSQSNAEVISMKKIANNELVKIALCWLRNNNHLYKKFPDLNATNNEQDTLYTTEIDNDVQTCNFENQNLTRSTAYIRRVFNNADQCSVIPNDFVLPEVDISSLLSSRKSLHLPTQFNQPIWISDIPHGEELAYPALFPLGVGGLTEKRLLKLTVIKYFQARLYHRDARWRKDIPYLMYAVNHMEQSRLSNDIEIQMRIRKGSSVSIRTLTNGSYNSEVAANSFMFMKNIRGTVAYWTEVLHDLLAMVKCIGPPTLFLTLSADDCHWPELDMLLTGRSYEECIRLPSSSSYMIADPLLTSIHFERRWKHLFHDIIKGPNGPFGDIIDMFARIEYQNRGSPHLHIFLWTYNSPNLHTSTSDEITKFIDKVIKSTLPNPEADKELFDLVSKLQIHHHTHTCMRRCNGICRFGFPRPETPTTHLLQNVNITNPNNRGRFYETMRRSTDTYVNAYNPIILKRWRANMDIQMVSGSSGLAYYVCSYIAKAEPDDLKEALSQVIHKISLQPQGYSMKKQLYLIGNCVLKSRRLSAQEAAARIGNLQFIWKSREVVFLNTRPPNQRFRILKPKSVRDQLPDDSTDIFSTNIIDYYTDRPSEMENITLFKYASNYKLSQDKILNISPRCLTRFKLQSLGKIMQQRRTPAVIRTPKFSGDSDEFYYSMLMLHLPFRNEQTVVGPYKSAKEAFINKHSCFDIADLQYESYLHDIERVVRFIRMTNDDLGTIIAPNTDEGVNIANETVAPEFDIMNTDQSSLDEPFTNKSGFNNDTASSTLHNLQVNMLSREEISEQVERLTSDQHKVFSVVQEHFTSKCTKALLCFCSGGAGTGKSFLIKTIVEWMRFFTSPFPGANTVIVCGPTGMSAKNINGKTIHTALKLPVQHGREPSYKELSSRALQILRSQFLNVHTLVIDEISMVSSRMLTFIHRRLCSIRQSNEHFGGMNVIVIGDFFQLKPIRGDFAFTNSLLWNSFDNYILNTNMRQCNDERYSCLLNRVRYGTINRDDLNDLISRLICDDDKDFVGALRVFPTLKEVNAFNARMQSQVKQTCIQIPAVHQFGSSDNTQENVTDEFIPKDDRDAGGLPRILSLSVGTRVMLIRNIATEQGLINGALGFVRSIIYEGVRPVKIFVQFDDESIGRMFYNTEHEGIGIEQISQEYYYHGRSIYRIQFPLLPAWACPIHKVQGISTDKIVVSLGHTVFADGMFYVALSRVRTLQGLGIITLDPTKVKANEKALAFYASLNLQGRHIHN